MIRIDKYGIVALLLGATFVASCCSWVPQSIAAARLAELNRALADGEINSSEFADTLRELDRSEFQLRRDRTYGDSGDENSIKAD